MTLESRAFEIAVLRNLLTQTTRAYEAQMAELHSEKELAQVTLASIADAVVTTDARGKVTFLNPVAEALIGWKNAEARGQPVIAVLRLLDDDEKPVTVDLSPCLREGRQLYLRDDITLVRRDGQLFSVEGGTSPIRDREQRIVGMVLVFRDVSERKLMALQLTRAAHYDGLTGLLNREAFDDHLRTALEKASHGDSHVLCYLDLDQFKVINDTCGHSAGDLVLQWISSLIRERVRDSDVVGRLGGDEFGLLLAHCSIADAERIADEIHRAMRSFRFAWQDRSFTIGVSIGLVPVTPEFQDLKDLIGAADHACYLAKEKGRRRSQVYERDTDEVRAHQGLLHWVVRLQRALDEDRFVLYWQRIRSLAPQARDLQVFEVLVRVQDDGEVHEPSEFLLAGERYGLMPSLDRWVVRRTLELLAEQPPNLLDRLDLCSINLSGASIGDAAMLDFIEQELERTSVPAGKLCFEITESSAINHLGQAAAMIARLSARGCRWALDDFGSGMSSYRYLRELPVQYLKIDGHIVTDLINNPLSRAMVKSINQIAHVMDLMTIAESVASQAMVRELAEIGVDFVQGFWIERPRPLALGESFGPPPAPLERRRTGRSP